MALRFARLTRPEIRALQAGQRITEYGITAERLNTGDVRYSVNVMVDGQRVHRVIGRESEGVTREQAERAIEKFRTDARSDRLDLPQGRKVHRTFAQAAEDYLSRLEATDGKDLANKRRHLRAYLVPALGTERLDKISEFRLKQYRRIRTNAGAKPATINRELSTLSHVFHRAASKGWGWMGKDDIPDIPKEKETRKKIRILTSEERTRLVQAAVADQDGRLWLFVLFGLNACMRHGEILRRRYDEIDWENCRIWIDKAKAGEREQPITPSLRDALARQRQGEADANGWIFPSAWKNSNQPYRKSMEDGFRRAVIRAGLNPKTCTPHIMRHTAITALVKNKTDVPTIQKISGHKTPAMVLHYVHIFGEYIDNEMSVLDVGIPDTITPELHTAPKQAEIGDSKLSRVFRVKSAA
jgi:integrase